MERPDDRSEDRGRGSRRLGMKDWIQIAGLVMMIGALVWQGGRVSEQLEGVAQRVQRVETGVESLRAQVTMEQIQASQVRVRVETHEKELSSIDRRLQRVERVGRNGDWRGP